MSREIDDLDLKVIQSSAQRSQKVSDLIQSKKEDLDNLSKSRFTSTTKPVPYPKPPGEIYIPPREKKENFSKEEHDKQAEKIIDDYDSKIKEAMVEEMNKKENKYHDFHKTKLDEMSNKEAAVLAEHDLEGYKEYLNQKDMEQEKTAEVDKQQEKETIQPDQDKSDKEIPLDNTELFHDNKETIEKDNREDQDYRLDDTQMDHLLNESRDYEMDDMEDSKNIDKDVDRDQDISHDTPDPGDDYE